MGCHAPGSQGSEIPGNVGPKEFLPLEGKEKLSVGCVYLARMGAGLCPCFGCGPSSLPAVILSPRVSLPSGQGFPGTPTAGAPPVCIGRTNLGQDRSTGNGAPA